MTVSERFLKYVSFGTNSDPGVQACPSTEGQTVLGKYLVEEMKAIGLSSVVRDEDGYVYGQIPATAGREGDPTIGFIAHMDTSDAVKGDGIKPQTVRYGGGDIPLCEGVSLTVEVFPQLKDYVGCTLITTDGRTLLGADDKAGIAEILSACEHLLSHPEIEHGRIAIAFTPDEEIGRGADRFDLARFGAAWAYTVDGGALGSIDYENFNAASAKITVHGVNIHPGRAKNKMKNALLMAADLINRMPKEETPAHTEGYEGFYHLCEMAGDESLSTLRYLIRDHDRKRFEERKRFVADLIKEMNEIYGEGTFLAEIKDSYYNMKEKIEPFMHIVESAKGAMRKVGIEPKILPVRGGTDGARLSYMGLPCPNLSTGGENYHSVYEFIPVEAMERMVEVLVHLMKR